MTALADPVDDLRRRSLLGALAAGALLTACGKDVRPASDEAADDGFPRSVEHGLGATEIPTRPTRVVATADRDQLDVLLAMGVVPVQYGLSGDYEPLAPWLGELDLGEAQAAEMPESFTPSLERIAAVQPDLIVDAWSDEAGHEDLSRIAPTVQVKSQETDSWESAQLLAGEAMGLEDRAADAVAETRAVIDAQAARLRAHRGLTVAVVYLLQDELIVLPGSAIGARLVAELGMTVLDTRNGEPSTHSLESIPDVLGPVDVVLAFSELPAGSGGQRLFDALPAVVAGRHVTVDPMVATACYQESSLSLRWSAPLVADALDLAARGAGGSA